VSPHSEGTLDEKLLELGDETVEEEMDSGVPMASDVAECTDDSFPFETTYAVQKLGMHSQILVAVLLPLFFLRNMLLEEPKTNLQTLNLLISSLIAVGTSSDSSKTASASTCTSDRVKMLF
jgi:hypothetical protein